MKLAAIGDNCVDYYDNLGKGYPGGNPVNVAVYFVRLGGQASYTGAIGDDKYGPIITEGLQRKGVDISHVHTLPGSTAVTHVNLLDGERVFGDYIEGVLADFKPTAADIDFLCTHDMVVSGIWGNVERSLPEINQRGVPITFDFSNQPHHPVVEYAMPYVDYAFFAFDDGDTPELREFLRAQQRRGPKIVIATLGEQGSLAFDGERFVSGGIVPCKVVDTMGAGDSYIAGFIKSTLDGKPLEECMHDGAANSSVTLGYEGAW